MDIHLIKLYTPRNSNKEYVDVRDFVAEKCIQNNEHIDVYYEKELIMKLTPTDLISKRDYISKELKSTINEGQTYRLWGYFYRNKTT